jgi:hypothetical protein
LARPGWLLFRSQLDSDYPQYDVSYDVRDRARLVNAILFSDGAPNIKDRAVDVFLSSKPAPKFADAAGIWKCSFADVNSKHVAKAVQIQICLYRVVNTALVPAAGRDAHTLGSLSNLLGSEMPGYLAMPAFPDVAPDPKPRQVEVCGAVQ